jgi:hypothetical protein
VTVHKTCGVCQYLKLSNILNTASVQQSANTLETVSVQQSANTLNTVSVQQSANTLNTVSLPNTSNNKTIKSESKLTAVRFKMSIQAVLMGKCTDDVCHTSSVHLHLQCIFNGKGEIFVPIIRRVCNCRAVVWRLTAAVFCWRGMLASGLLCVCV